MSFKSVASSFSGIVSAVKVMLTGIAMNAQDKATITGILSDLEKAAEELSGVAVKAVTVRKSDVEAAVKAVLPALVAEAVKGALADAQGTPEPAPATDAGTDTATVVKND
jgi:hypothetical protein